MVIVYKNYNIICLILILRTSFSTSYQNAWIIHIKVKMTKTEKMFLFANLL